ncbi:MAG: RidA family protein [Burkholderiaceae bacterium]|jgi:enamine deaminase RidA (YjgF/YER057c/UK114 family)|nr:RidA family protein [Burkholderiaceae bacterium]
MSLHKINPQTHWSTAVSTGPLLFLSGQTANGAQGCADIASQTQEALRRVERILEANQSSKAHLVSATIYLRHTADFPKVNEVWSRWLDGLEPPARSTLQAAPVQPHLDIEISAVAMRHNNAMERTA